MAAAPRTACGSTLAASTSPRSSAGSVAQRVVAHDPQRRSTRRRAAGGRPGRRRCPFARATSVIVVAARARTRAAGRASTRPARTRACPSRPASRRSTSPTTLSAAVRAPSKNDLVELRCAGDLHDRPDLDAGLVHRHEQVREARCLGASRSVRHSTKHHCAQCASDVHTFWPVITHSSPSSSARVCTLARSEPAFGLGVALAPDLVAARGCRAGTARFCSSVPKCDDRRAEQALADDADAARAAGARVLLVEDHLLEQATRRGRRTRFGQPTADPAVARRARCSHAQPLLEELVLVARTAAARARRRTRPSSRSVEPGPRPRRGRPRPRR